MKFITHLLLFLSLLTFSNCRKDPPLIGLEPMGNTLILQLNEHYEIEGAAELMLNVDYQENALNLVYDAAPNQSPTTFVLQFANTLDTVLYLRNQILITPSLDTSRMNLKDGRLFTKITEADFIPLLGSNYNLTQLIEQVGDSRLLHGYFDSSSGNKITVYSAIINIFDAEIGMSIPTLKYYLFIAL